MKVVGRKCAKKVVGPMPARVRRSVRKFATASVRKAHARKTNVRKESAPTEIVGPTANVGRRNRRAGSAIGCPRSDQADFNPEP